MKKRVLASFLWFLTGWYAGAMLAELLHTTTALAPIMGAVAAGLIYADPRRAIWKERVSGPVSVREGAPEPA